MLVAEFFKKNKLLLLFLSLIVVIAVAAGTIYYINLKTGVTNNLFASGKLKGYEELKQKANALTADKQINETPDLGKFIAKLTLLEDKSMSDEKKYETLRDAFERLTSLYSLTNNPKVNEIVMEIGPFAKENFPKYYKDYHFQYYCQDTTCAENPPPNEILDFIEEINASDMPGAVKHSAATNLLNTTFLPEKEKDQIINSFLITYTMLRDGIDFSKTGANKKIANDIFEYIQKRYPEDMKKILSSPQSRENGLVK